MPLRRRASPAATAEDRARIARELLRLDPWSYWAVELEGDAGASHAVLGTTGAFVLGPCPLEGYLVAEGRGLTIGAERVGGFRELRAAAKTLRGNLTTIGSVSTDVEPILVLTRAIAGAPREHGGVHVVRPEDVAPTITGRRERDVLDPSTSQRLAGRIGRPLRSASGPADESS
jgi:hypothetical protein